MVTKIKCFKGLIGLVIGVVFAAHANAQSAGWAHQTGALNSNGAIVVKGASGSSYNGTQNPSGAIAKANQNAVTQPPTVIIQATGSYVQMIPLQSGSTTVPTCPATYHSVFTAVSTSFPGGLTYPIYNIASSRFSLGQNGSGNIGWFTDTPMIQIWSGNTTPAFSGATLANQIANNGTWSVNLCSQ